ncbi:hypothetical protein ABPG72_002934 [Tetrahymena utriculariae]
MQLYQNQQKLAQVIENEQTIRQICKLRYQELNQIYQYNKANFNTLEIININLIKKIIKSLVKKKRKNKQTKKDFEINCEHFPQLLREKINSPFENKQQNQILIETNKQTTCLASYQFDLIKY